MGHYSGVENAKASVRTPRFVAGSYVLKVKKVKMIRSRKNEDLLVREFEVIQSSTPERSVGSDIGDMLPTRLDAFQGNVKSFLAAVYKQPDSKITEAVCEMSEDKDQKDPTTGAITEKPGATRGRLVRADAAWGKLKDKSDFLFVNFTAYDPNAAPIALGAAIPAPASQTAAPVATAPLQNFAPPPQAAPQAAAPQATAAEPFPF